MPGLGHILTKAAKDSRFVRQMVKDTLRHVPEPAKGARLSCPFDYAATWLGHASFHLSFGGLNMLCDPVLSNRIGPAVGPFTFGIKRLSGIPYRCEALPGADVILLTHAHFDHMDLRSLKKIARVMSPRAVLTAPGTSDLVFPLFPEASVRALAPGEIQSIANAEVQAVAVSHKGARWRYDVGRETVGYLVGDQNRKALFIGDTAYNAELLDNYAAMRSIDIAMLPIGGYEPFRHHHVTPEEAYEIAKAAGARRLVPHHHSTFALSFEPVDEPLERLRAVAQGGEMDLIDLGIGQSITF